MSAAPAFAPSPARVALCAGDSVSGTVTVPGSKSQTNRVLVMAALADGVSHVTDAMVADDSVHMVAALRSLGVAVEPLDDTSRNWRVTGCGGQLPHHGPVTVDAGLAGTVMRFISAVATLAPNATTITGRAPLRARPIRELLTALRAIGADVHGSGEHDGYPPVLVGPTRPRGGPVTVDARRSSQFASALAAVSPCWVNGIDLRVDGLEASGYFDLTVELMRRRGIGLDRTAGGVRVEPGRYRALDERIPGDISSASHLFTMAAATGGQVRVGNLGGPELQPDFGILDTLAAFGCDVHHGDDGSVAVTGPARLSPLTVDLSGTPDQLPNVAVLAALASGRSVISGVGVTRFHETDRIAAIEREFAKIGVSVSSTVDTVFISGGTARPGAELTTYHDHRLAMAFAALGLAVGDTVVEGADCVEKTFPSFWDTVENIGGHIVRIGTA